MKYPALFMFTLFTLIVTAHAQQRNEQITVDGLQRKFVTYIPTATNNNDMPILISLHGRLGNGMGMMKFADFRPLAEKYKFIIVCPDGIDRSWNDGRATPSNRKGVNDVNFIGRLITYIVDTYRGDAKRVYVTGMSNGGFMASRLACELPGRIAAIAAVGASLDKDVDYHPTQPMPVMYIQGTKDPLVPFGGGAPRAAKGDVYGHEETLKLWAAADDCDKAPVVTNFPDKAGDGTSIIKEEYSNKTMGVKVTGYTITNGGHTWPDGTQYLPRFMIGDVSHNLDACAVIWDFFRGYRLVD